MMLSLKTYHLFNINRTYLRSSLVAIGHRLSTNHCNTHSILANNHKTCPSLAIISMRHLSDGPNATKSGAKRPQPLKLTLVDDEPRLSHTERLKRIIQNYGSTAVILHICLSLTSLGTFYTIVYFGLDVTEYLPMHLFNETAAKMVAGSGTFAVAYAIHKMIMPVRVGATVLLTPIVVQQLRRFGIIKKPHKHI